MGENVNRRDFLLKSASAGAGIALTGLISPSFGRESSTSAPRPFIPGKQMDKVRIGFVGVGGQGTSHVENLLKIKGAEIVAVGDIVESRVLRAQDMVMKAGQPKPGGYSRNETDFKRMCERKDIDLIFNATPWEWHVPICLEAMKTEKHAATEVPVAYTVDDCWKLVETSEKTGKYCIMMENCNYDKYEMMALNMVMKGLLGELLYAECGYLHDLRAVKHDMEGEGVWRRKHSMQRNGDLYPTHGFGPIAQCFDINRGNYIDFLVSFGTKTRGLHQYAVEKFGLDSPQAKEEYKLSDIVTTMLHTKNGETIIVKHDTNNPRPYSRDILIQGTKGILRKYPEPKVYVEGKSKPHQWDSVDDWMKEYIHPVWTKLEAQSKGAGHGGMDFIEDLRLIEALLKGEEPDMDVYDAAVMSAITKLSARSISNNGEAQKFPDFTRGMWKKTRTLKVMEVKA